MMSLRGSNGTRVGPLACSLSSLFSLRNNIISSLLSTFRSLGVYDNRRLVSIDHFLRNNDLFDVRLGRHVVHYLEHNIFHYRPQTTRSRLSFHGLASDCLERFLGE